MSKKNDRKWSMDEAEGVLLDVYPLIFHELMRPFYVSLSLAMAKQMKGIAKLAEPNAWAKAMATAYTNSDVFAEFLESCISHAFDTLSNADPQTHLEDFRFTETNISPNASDALRATQVFLLKNPDSSKWLALIFFGLSRGISVTAKNNFESNEWSEFSIFAMQLEQSFVQGNGKLLSRMLTREMKTYTDSFPARIADNMPLGLATMAALDAKSSFFAGTDPARLH
ncbi:hypothetical protein [Geopseudomonas aromaticivorans]